MGDVVLRRRLEPTLEIDVFGGRIGATLLAEGIEKRVDLATLRELGVDLGQGYLLGRPAGEPQPPRPMGLGSREPAREPARVPSGA